MADKTIGELPGVTSLDSDSLFVAQQQGVASKVTGAQLTRFANVETAAQVAAAQAAAEGAKRSETEAESSKQAAQTAAEQYPYIGENGHWYVFSASTGQFVDSGVAAQGPTGPTGPAGGVDTFNGRTGAVMPAAGDYTAAMVGAAPEGYGLGANAPTAPAGDDGLADPDLITKTGFYYAVKNLHPGGRNLWSTVLHINTTSTSATQFVIGMQYTPIGARLKTNGVWGPWEWINPLLEVGVEYRTVERYLGKPVYIKLVNCGTFAAPGTVKTVTFDDTGTLLRVIDFGGEIVSSSHVWAFPTFLYGAAYADTSIVLAEARVSSGIGYIYLYTKTRDLTNDLAYVWIKYTKKTD